MFILYAVGIGILLGLLVGGRLERIGWVGIHWWPLAIAGLLVQLILFSPLADGFAEVPGTVLYTASTIAVLGVVVRNMRLRGLPLVAVGAALNLAAILANGGHMPADPGALAAAGRTAEPAGISNGTLTAHPLLAPLTDIFAIPAGIPLANVFSIGDVLIGLGIAVALVSLMRTPVPTIRVNSVVHPGDDRA